jgi:hypothetical protein
MDNNTLINIFDFLEKEENKISSRFNQNREGIKLKASFENGTPLTKEELDIKGSLDLMKTKITSLPKGLKVGGSLYLSDSHIESLPEYLYVGEHLFLENCKNITSLPKGLKVEGDLYISLTNLSNYPEDELRKMIEPGYIKYEIIDHYDPWNTP